MVIKAVFSYKFKPYLLVIALSTLSTLYISLNRMSLKIKITEIWSDKTKLIRIELHEMQSKSLNWGRVFVVIGGDSLIIDMKIDISDFMLKVAKDWAKDNRLTNI